MASGKRRRGPEAEGAIDDIIASVSGNASSSTVATPPSSTSELPPRKRARGEASSADELWRFGEEVLGPRDLSLAAICEKLGLSVAPAPRNRGQEKIGRPRNVSLTIWPFAATGERHPITLIPASMEDGPELCTEIGAKKDEVLHSIVGVAMQAASRNNDAQPDLKRYCNLANVTSALVEMGLARSIDGKLAVESSDSASLSEEKAFEGASASLASSSSAAAASAATAAESTAFAKSTMPLPAPAPTPAPTAYTWDLVSWPPNADSEQRGTVLELAVHVVLDGTFAKLADASAPGAVLRYIRVGEIEALDEKGAYAGVLSNSSIRLKPIRLIKRIVQITKMSHSPHLNLLFKALAVLSAGGDVSTFDNVLGRSLFSEPPHEYRPVIRPRNSSSEYCSYVVQPGVRESLGYDNTYAYYAPTRELAEAASADLKPVLAAAYAASPILIDVAMVFSAWKRKRYVQEYLDGSRDPHLLRARGEADPCGLGVTCFDPGSEQGAGRTHICSAAALLTRSPMCKGLSVVCLLMVGNVCIFCYVWKNFRKRLQLAVILILLKLRCILRRDSRRTTQQLALSMIPPTPQPTQHELDGLPINALNTSLPMGETLVTFNSTLPGSQAGNGFEASVNTAMLNDWVTFIEYLGDKHLDVERLDGSLMTVWPSGVEAALDFAGVLPEQRPLKRLAAFKGTTRLLAASIDLDLQIQHEQRGKIRQAVLPSHAFLQGRLLKWKANAWNIVKAGGTGSVASLRFGSWTIASGSMEAHVEALVLPAQREMTTMLLAMQPEEAASWAASYASKNSSLYAKASGRHEITPPRFTPANMYDELDTADDEAEQMRLSVIRAVAERAAGIDLDAELSKVAHTENFWCGRRYSRVYAARLAAEWQDEREWCLKQLHELRQEIPASIAHDAVLGPRLSTDEPDEAQQLFSLRLGDDEAEMVEILGRLVSREDDCDPEVERDGDEDGEGSDAESDADVATDADALRQPEMYAGETEAEDDAATPAEPAESPSNNNDTAARGSIANLYLKLARQLVDSCASGEPGWRDGRRGMLGRTPVVKWDDLRLSVLGHRKHSDAFGRDYANARTESRALNFLIESYPFASLIVLFREWRKPTLAKMRRIVALHADTAFPMPALAQLLALPDEQLGDLDVSYFADWVDNDGDGLSRRRKKTRADARKAKVDKGKAKADAQGDKSNKGKGRAS